VYRDGKACLSQGQGRGQAADAAANDRDLHPFNPLLYSPRGSGQ
jgi:hypothetical protein